MCHHVDVEGNVVMSQLSVFSDDVVEDRFPADVVSETQLLSLQMKQTSNSSLLVVWM